MPLPMPIPTHPSLKAGLPPALGSPPCLTAPAGYSLPKLEEMVDRLAWLCRVPEGLGEDSSSESLSKGTNSGRGSPSGGPGAISRPEPAMEMCRQGWGPGSASVAASSSAASTSSSGPVGSGAVSGGFLRDAVRSLLRRSGGDEAASSQALPHSPARPPGPAHITRTRPHHLGAAAVCVGGGDPVPRPRPGGASPVAPALQAWHGPDAEDAGGADGDAGLHVRLGAQAQQAHLAHVAVAVAHPHLGRGLWAAAQGRGCA